MAAQDNAPPAWSYRFLGKNADEREFTHDRMLVHTLDGTRSTLVSVRVPDAALMDASGFRNATTAAYHEISSLLSDRRDRHLVRVWNLIPGILTPLEPYPQRYMAFNAGRLQAYEDWYRQEDELGKQLPTASGVGHAGSDLVIHALAWDVAGAPVENPRQIPAYRYSRRYGPSPPCFSRATRLGRAELETAVLLIGGTASVVGENTTYDSDLEAQIQETFANLTALIGVGLSDGGNGSILADPLSAFRYLRAYYVSEEHIDPIKRSVHERCTGLQQVEIVEATLCRPDLLVEVEGVACKHPRPDLESGR
jgi:chorismate lyase/3-hydroxybenzoate synthase